MSTTKRNREGHVQLWLTPELHAQIKKKATEDVRTIANYIEWVLRKHLKEESADEHHSSNG